jgi:hypothetical protein
MNYPPNNFRPVQINFELYVDSDDTAFKLELILLMISNVEELKAASTKAWTNGDVAIFNASTHKTKSTITLLDDAEFNGAIELVGKHLCDASFTHHDDVINRLLGLCDGINASLTHEASLLKSEP